MKRIILILTFLSCLAICCVAQSNSEIQELKNKIERLEISEKLRDKDLDLKKRELSEQISQDLTKAKDEIKDSNWLITWVGLPITILGLVGLWISSILYINKKHRDFVDNLSSGKANSFHKAISLQEFENKVKSGKNILILSIGENEENELKSLLFSLGFKDPTRIQFQHVRQFQKPSTRKDLIIFNDIGKKFSSEHKTLMEEYWNGCGDTQVFLAYSPGQGQIPSHSQMNFANSQFTLYQQILNTIKVGDLLNQS